MAQRGKQWLYSANERYDRSGFPIEKGDGGIAGSLAGLGFVKTVTKNNITKYQITPEGQEWIKYQGVK